MDHRAAATLMAEFISEITDPKIARWTKDQLEIQARIIAKTYLKKVNS